MVAPGRGAQLIRMLTAVDEFLSANELLCDHVRDRFTSGLSQSIDQSRWCAGLGIFSQYVSLISERIEGDTAEVAFTIDDRIPVHRVQLVIVENEWRYDPGAGYDERLPNAFQRMAKGLRQVLGDLESGQLTDEQIRTDPARLVEEVRLRLSPGIKLLPKLDDEDADEDE